MPTYEYACKQCGEQLEVVQKFTDEPLTTCPACSGPLRKVFGSIGISFKGSGFYKTDSRTSENGSSTKKEKEPAGGDAKPSTSTETPKAKDAPAKDSGSSTAAAS